MSHGKSWLQRMLARKDSAAADGPSLVRLGHAADAEKRFEAAADLFRRAIDAGVEGVEAHYGLGVSLAKAGRHREAEAVFREGLTRDPRSVPILNGQAASLIALGRARDAMPLLERARALDPLHAETHVRLARVSLETGRLAAALDFLRRAHELAPQDAAIHSALLFAMNYSSDFGPEALFEAHRRFGDLQARAVVPPPAEGGRRRLRIGYLSPDFRSHVVSTFMLPIVARHDRARFEVFCYYLHTEADRVTDGMRELADRWRDCGGLAPDAIAARIREDRIDILVDLAGHTMNNGLPVLALRPAPLQATYLGYPNTTGLPAVDVRLTDARADPPGESDRLHTERLLRLPRTFLCYRPGPGMEPTPLPAWRRGGVTFGCFNNHLKLSTPFLALAARLLAQVPGSRLLLKDRVFDFPQARATMQAFFEKAGIDARRIDLRGWTQTAESHLSAYGEVDVALDSFPYNGTTTTCEALWMGVPVVTLHGNRHAGRVGTSLLGTVGLDELIASNEDEYVRIAAALAGDLGRLEQLRASLRDRMRASPLLDEVGFVRSLEDCLTALWSEKVSASGRPQHELEAFWNHALDERRYGEALGRLGEALAGGDSAQLRYMIGCTLQEAGRTEEARAAYRRVLEMQPGHAKASNNLGSLLEMSGDAAAAARCYDDALRADEKLAVAYSNRGNLRKGSDPAAAEADLRRALALDPTQAEWRANLGDCLALQWKLDEALAEHQAAVAMAPGNARLHFCLGNTLVRLGEMEAAEAALRRAIELDPGFDEAHSSLLFSLHYRHGDKPHMLCEAHAAWSRGRARVQAAPVRASRSASPMRIGYVSPDFRGHAVALFLAPLLAAHDRSKFRIYGYSTATQSDAVTARLRGLCDEWRELATLSDEAAARSIAADDLDIVVDLAGHTAGGRPLVFARKPAPVQVAWLGYPGTTGLGAIDYRFTDARADPPGEADAHATEKLWRLPDGFLCFTPAVDVPLGDLPATRRGRVTFGSFNNLAKISPGVVTAWAALLREVPEARLMLKAHGLRSERARRRLASAFAAEGIAENRLVFLVAEARVEAHLQRYHEIDVALDTFPYAGTTTTCEALWMGVPVVTLRGNSHVSRVGASVLGQLRLDELVAGSPDEYVALAKALALDLPRLRELRRGLRERMQRSSLMDGPRFARAVEDAYRAMRGAEPLRLHVGGREARAGWKIVNVQPGPGVDFVGDCADLSQFRDGSVDEIYASHVLEHLGYQSALPRALKEFHRVLKPGGVARISVPDLERLARMFLDPSYTIDDRFRSMRMIFGGQVDDHDYHRVGLSAEFLTQYLLHAGFSRVERVERFDLFDDMSSLQMRDQLISLNVVAHK